MGSLATLPFALFHFERATHYAVLGNLIAMPVMGFWVMPAAALSVVLMPLGLEGWPLHLLGQGIDVMVAMGRWVSGLAGRGVAGARHAAQRAGADFAGRACGFCSGARAGAGGAWRRSLAGAVLAWFAPLPDMLVASDGATVALRGGGWKAAFPEEAHATDMPRATGCGAMAIRAISRMRSACRA